MSGSLEEVQAILAEIVESPPTTEQYFERGYRWVCTYCSQPLTEHDEKCAIKRALDWLRPSTET